MSELDSNFYRLKKNNITKARSPKSGSVDMRYPPYSHQKQLNIDQTATIAQLKNQNLKLKKLLKEAQAKRTQVTKHCSQLTNKVENLEEENMCLLQKLKDSKEITEGERFRLDELKFLNKELNTEIEELRKENEQFNEKLHYHSQILERKYDELENKTYKRIDQALRRIKKSIHYLSSFNAREIEKTKQIQVENLQKVVEILKGKFNEDQYEEQIQELMSPIKNIQEQLHAKNKQLLTLKEENNRMIQEVRKHKKIEKELLPQYKEAIQKLKKNLSQVRTQLSQNQYEKCQLKKKYEQKLKQSQYKYGQLFREHRKIKLENKIYENKLEEMQADVEEQKERLLGENQMLKRLYRNEQQVNDGASYKTTKNFNKNDIMEPESESSEISHQHQHRFMKKNHSANQLRNSSTGNLSINESRSRVRPVQSKLDHLRHKHPSLQTKKKLEIGQSCSYQEDGESNSFQQENLKHQIFRIDQDIIQIQKQLANQLDSYQ